MFKVKYEIAGQRKFNKVEVHSVAMLSLITKTYISAIESNTGIKFEYIISMLNGLIEQIEVGTAVFPVTLTDEFLKVTIDIKV